MVAAASFATDDEDPSSHLARARSVFAGRHAGAVAAAQAQLMRGFAGELRGRAEQLAHWRLDDGTPADIRAIRLDCIARLADAEAAFETMAARFAGLASEQSAATPPPEGDA